MAICNIFNRLKNPTGNFLTFSQYVEDLTRESTQSAYYRVTPSKFIAAYIDYKRLNYNNDSISRDLQNKFENGCAVCRKEMENTWTPTNSTNLFWNALLDMGLISGDEEGYINEIKYVGDINLQSYNEHDGVGYSEIYCYIPNDAAEHKYQYIINNNALSFPSKSIIEGYKKDELDGWESIGDALIYKPYQIVDFPWSYDILTKKEMGSDSFQINTIIVLYDILTKTDTGSEVIYKNIPLGIYFTGLTDADGNMGNVITKYTHNKDIYGAGTSYGLRICSRFTVTPNQDNIKVLDVVVENDNYAAISQVMSQISESQTKMDEILTKIQSNTSAEKELLAIFKNSKTNVPYVKNINGIDYWFVNGKNVSPLLGNADYEYTSYTNEEILYMMSRSASLVASLLAHDENMETIFDLSEVEFKNINLSWEILFNEYITTPDELKLTIKTEDDIVIDQLNTNLYNIVMKNVSETTEYSINVLKDGLNAEASAKVYFVHPSFFGTLPCNNDCNEYGDSHEFMPTESAIKTLDKYIHTSKKQEYVYTNLSKENGKTDHMVFAYPKKFGALTSILDSYGYDYIDDFYKYEKTISFGSTPIEYFIYVDKIPSEVEEFEIKFT